MNRLEVVSPAPRWQFSLEECPASVSWSDCGRWLAASTMAGDICVVDVESGRAAWQRHAHENGLHSLSWQPGSAVLTSCGQDAAVRQWDLDAGGQLRCRQEWYLENAVTTWIEHLQWRPDGRQLAVAAGRHVFLFSPEGIAQGRCGFPDSTVGALCWRPKGAQLAVCGYGGVRLFNVLDPGSKPQKLTWKGSLLSLSWSPDAKVIAAGCQDNSVHFWRLPEGKDAVMSGFSSKPLQLCWSRNSRWLASGGSEQLILWPFDRKGPEGRAPVAIEWHGQAISALAGGAGSKWFASGCRGGEVALWRQLGDTVPAARIQLHSRIECLAWSPVKKGACLAVVSRNGTLGLWDAH